MRGVSGLSEVERMADGNYSDVNAIKAEFSFGLHVLPVSLLVSPEEKYRARAAKQENVDGAVHRLLQFGKWWWFCSSVRTRLCPRSLGSSRL